MHSKNIASFSSKVVKNLSSNTSDCIKNTTSISKGILENIPAVDAVCLKLKNQSLALGTSLKEIFKCDYEIFSRKMPDIILNEESLNAKTAYNEILHNMISDAKFDNFSESDKKILLCVAALSQKVKNVDLSTMISNIGLKHDEELKLYSLCKNLDLLKDIDISQAIEGNFDNQFKLIAWEMCRDNSLEMLEMLIKAENNANLDLNVSQNDINSVFKQLKNLSTKYTASQPFLPVTEFPSMTKIKQNLRESILSKLNISPGKTNVNGVYLSKDGLVVIKFNEVANKDWQKLGFPNGTKSKGIKAIGNYNNDKSTETYSINVDTGNLKFFVHGTGDEKSVKNFANLSNLDSRAALSVSYADRAESKYRFFQPQGLIIDFDIYDVCVGGIDMHGTGFKKNIEDVLSEYLFLDKGKTSQKIGISYEQCRSFVSDLIKKELKLNNEQYVDFVKNNANKPIQEIEPKELQEKLVKALASIKSEKRSKVPLFPYIREYNELIGIRPKVMGTFAYDSSSKQNKKSVLEFIEEVPEYIKQYSIENDFPLIVFGD